MGLRIIIAEIIKWYLIVGSVIAIMIFSLEFFTAIFVHDHDIYGDKLPKLVQLWLRITGREWELKSPGEK